MTAEQTFDQFYSEAAEILAGVIAETAPGADIAPLDDALQLNRLLVSQPFVTDDISTDLRYDLTTFYQSVRKNEPATLQKLENTILIERSAKSYDDLQTWCREVVWWGNKKGAYLYSNRTGEKQLAGHY